MTGINHAAVGGLLAVALPLPIAIPAALASHFILDMLPHYGIPQERRDKSVFWRFFGTADFLAVIVFLAFVVLVVWQRWDIFICALVAVSPDLVWVARIIRTRSFNLSKNETRFTRWHARIQRLERPWGVFVEIPLAVGLVALLASMIR